MGMELTYYTLIADEKGMKSENEESKSVRPELM